MKTIVHKAHTRGHVNHGWLDTYHTFSFANYYNKKRIQFGTLRVLNDDTVQGRGGFGTHPHDNMEIITIVLEGALEHKDSMGNAGVIKENEIQVMSAGTGIYHSEYNYNTDHPVQLFQIWVFPREQNVEPRYGQITLDPKDRRNKLQQVVSPNPDDEGVWIHQDAWFFRGYLESNAEITYKLKKEGNGLYLFIIHGEVEVHGKSLKKRDGVGIWETEKIAIKTLADSEILLMEIPF